MTSDVLVIGGGPAGMMAAGTAAASGARAVLLEKNEKLGKKLLITGGGRCNVTNAQFDTALLLQRYRANKKFLFSPFSQFAVQEALDFFQGRGMLTKIEAEGRVFPVSDTAQSVWDVLVEYMREGGVDVRMNTEVAGFVAGAGKVSGVRLTSGEVLSAENYILATGGRSRPETGSTGDGFKWLEKIGHTVIEPSSALVPVTVAEEWVHKLAGVSLQDVKLTIWQDGQRVSSAKGKMLFTHVGLSGPLVLNMSADIGVALQTGEVKLSLDLLPGLDTSAVDGTLQTLFAETSNKMIKNSLGRLVQPSLAPALIALAEISPETLVNSVSREQRLALGQLVKAVPMTVTGLLGKDKAVVTSGGVALEEVDFKTMKSRLYNNLYFTGDILHIDRPSGGYSLQLCWTTGYVAGLSAAAK